MENMLDEYMQEMIDSDPYKEDFEAFESDADSMLILGQPIDDQITTRNIASFAIPQKKNGYAESDSDGEDCDYEEESFESPDKPSPRKQIFTEMSSITFGQSNIIENPYQELQAAIAVPTTKKKLKRKKKKRVPPGQSLASTSNPLEQTSNHEYSSTPNQKLMSQQTTQSDQQHHQQQQKMNKTPTPYRPVGHPPLPVSRGAPPSRSEGSGGGGLTSRSGGPRSHSHLSHRTHTAGRTASSTGTGASLTIPQPTGSNMGPRTGSTAASVRRTELLTPAGSALRPPAGSGPAGGLSGGASVVSQVTAHSAAAAKSHVQHHATTNALLQRQLNNALKQVAIYRRENEVLQANLDVTGINEAVERYKALLIEKEHYILQLESENNGLKSITRYQSKYLTQQQQKQHEEGNNENNYMNPNKQIEVMLIHTRKLKEKMKKIEGKEAELLQENERLHTQNIRIQRKNIKLKKQVSELMKPSPSKPVGGVGQDMSLKDAATASILDELMHREKETEGLRGEADTAVSETSVECSSSSQLQPGPTESASLHTLAAASLSPPSYTRDTTKVINSQTLPTAAGTSSNSSTGSKLTTKQRLEQAEIVVRKQGMMIVALERSLASQRGRFMREIDALKSQTATALAEQKRLEVELDKRERFGRNQVNTLKQIRSAYDELSTGYQKLLSASELFNRDTLQMDSMGVEASTQNAPPAGVSASPLQMGRIMRKAGLLSEGEECVGDSNVLNSCTTYNILHQQQQQQQQLPPQAHSQDGLHQPPPLLTPVRPSSPKKTPMPGDPDSSSSIRVSNAHQLATTLVRRLTFIPPITGNSDVGNNTEAPQL